MDLLPKDQSEFREKSYWDSFFRKRGKKAFEWYGEYGELCGILHKYIKPNDDVLMVGCGNSKLSSDLYDVGYKNMVSIDISDKVIDQMQRQNAQCRPGLKFAVQDVTNMQSFAQNGQFSVALDKGTLDALFTDDSDSVVANVEAMFSEIDRVLKFGGRYVTISLLQPHILKHIVHYFCHHGWPVRIVRCKEADESKPPEDRIYPVFAFIATKFKKIPGMKPILEFALSSDGHLSRLNSPEVLVASVKGIQQFAAVRAGVARESSDARQSDVSLDLVADGKVRYSLYLVDHLSIKQPKLKFAIFIVPQGREAEWLFSTNPGRLQLCESSGCQRLVVVHLSRDQIYESLDQTKTEISAHALELAPSDLPLNFTVPILSVGADNSVGQRVERCNGNSELSGKYVVEDVNVDNEWYRRLIFLQNPNLIQSEAKIKLEKKKKTTKRSVDLRHLCCSHHEKIAESLAFFNSKPKVLIVGLGGGSLPSYISLAFKNSSVHVVELDPAIVRVAKDQFGFQENDRLKVTVQDGVEYIRNSKEKYDLVIFDVDNKDVSIGMSCPPKPFIDPSFLEVIRDHLRNKGIFVLNMVCRDSVLKGNVLKDLRTVFDVAIEVDIPQEVNTLVYCSNSKEEVINAFQKGDLGGVIDDCKNNLQIS